MMNFELPPSGVYDYVPRARIRWGQAAGAAMREEITDTDRVFILTTASLVTKTPVISDLQVGLGAQCVGLFHNVSEHTPFGDVVAAAQAIRDTHADIILSVGGGSIIDAAKAVIICLRKISIRSRPYQPASGKSAKGPAARAIFACRRHCRVPSILNLPVA